MSAGYCIDALLIFDGESPVTLADIIRRLEADGDIVVLSYDHHHDMMRRTLRITRREKAKCFSNT